MSDDAIWAQQLTKDYGWVQALQGLDLHVPRGAVYGFLGRNGAGKTTTMRTLLGLARPASGTARVLGFDVVRQNLDVLQRTAFVSERKPLYIWMTGRQLLRFHLSFYPRWDQGRADRYCRLLEIPLDRRVRDLSHGNRTKLCLVAALAQCAELLILDEPTDGLDPVVQDDVLRLMIEDHVAAGRTVFFSSHHLAEVEQIADWVGIIDGGRLLLEARLDDIRDDFRLVIAGAGPTACQYGDYVLSVVDDGSTRKYILTGEADSFVGALQRDGAQILQVSHLTLREVFLALVRKEEPCTSGNCGVTAALVS